jgi:hypothetical protein
MYDLGGRLMAQEVVLLPQDGPKPNLVRGESLRTINGPDRPHDIAVKSDRVCAAPQQGPSDPLQQSYRASLQHGHGSYCV